MKDWNNSVCSHFSFIISYLCIYSVFAGLYSLIICSKLIKALICANKIHIRNK